MCGVSSLLIVLHSFPSPRPAAFLSVAAAPPLPSLPPAAAMSEAAAATSEPKEEQQVSTESTDAGASAAEGSAELDDTDAEIEAMKARVAEMEEEAKRMSELSSATASGGAGAKGSPSALSPEQIIEQDKRSIYVGQVDYSVTEEELKKLFEACGPVNRCTILKDKYSGQPKGFAYIEFTSADSIANAMILNETEFKGRTLKVSERGMKKRSSVGCRWSS